MKHLFVSPEKILGQRYKHDRGFRAAGFLLIAMVFLQLPLGVLGCFLWNRCQEQSAIQSQNRIRAVDLQSRNENLHDVRQKIGQIRQWEPILRSRIPSGAILSAIQKGIPPDVVLDSVAIETGDYQVVPVTGGTYRVPKDYMLLLQATAKTDSASAIDRFKDSLAKILPPGTELLRTSRLDKRSDGLIPIQMQYSIKPTGNYLSLGLTKISEPDSL
ncbi:MAG: hypothetical protein WB696_03890 [Chthoniobacterales bacterium]